MAEYAELIKALRLCQFGECGCGKCYYKELKGDWCTEDNHPEFFDCDDKLKLDAADAIEDMAKHITEMHERVTVLQIARGKLEEEVDALKHDIARYVQMNTDLLNEPPQFGKAGNQYTLIEPKNKRYTLRCPKCGTVVGLMEVQDD